VLIRILAYIYNLYMNGIKTFFKNRENTILFLTSSVLAFITLLFISRRVEFLFSLNFIQNIDTFYIFYFIIIVMAFGTVFFFDNNTGLKKPIKKLFLTFLPAVFVLSIGLNNSFFFNRFIYLTAGLYIIIFGIYILSRRVFVWEKRESRDALAKSPEKWIREQGYVYIGILVIVMALNLGFGLYHIGKFAAVDEPLWTFDRIPNFWKDISKANWNGSRVSDKPGVTVALIAGPGLFFVNPLEYKYIDPQSADLPYAKDIEDMNNAFRIPIFLFVFLSLPFFYFILERLFDKKTALIGIIFIGLSPILIGMARIINPDSVIWAFSTLSILSFFAYLKRRRRKYLYAAAILVGLSILTKYVANILFIFFFVLLFMDYILNQKKYSEISVSKYIKESMLDYFSLIFVALATFFLLYPAVWVKYSRLLIGTIYSQAFISIWKIFLGLIIFILLDNYALKSKIMSSILNFFIKIKKWIVSFFVLFFFVSAAFVFTNVYLGMKFFDFEDVLSSPKSAYHVAGLHGIFFANFYPLIFGVSPLIFALLIFYLARLAIKNWKREIDFTEQTAFYMIVFVLIYYVASSIEHVASIIRYQMMLFPLILIISALAAKEIIRKYKATALVQISVLLFLVVMGAYSLKTTFPYYTSYASSLLPQQYYTDLKDMGTGSYEAAQYLNSLPNPQKLIVWTDKKGLCTFFKGNCFSSFVASEIQDINFDYVIVSSGRETRTAAMAKSKLQDRVDETKYFNKYYDQEENLVYKINVNGRLSQFIKIFKVVAD
jgi:4-amino-4-deoxy-L-arabinose transferase-like glycosyltransferase